MTLKQNHAFLAPLHCLESLNLRVSHQKKKGLDVQSLLRNNAFLTIILQTETHDLENIQSQNFENSLMSL